MDLQNDTAVLHILEVLQDKQEPLKIGRFLHSRNQFFASTSEILLCHAFTACMIAVVVPKGSTIDQVCGPRDSYEVLKRILLPSRPTQEGAVTKCDSPQVESSALAPKALKDESDKSRPPSYVTRQEPVGKVQPLVTASTTLPWTKNEDGLGSQMPQPVKLASLKDNDDVPMDDAECLEGAGYTDYDMVDSKREENKRIEPSKTEQKKEPYKPLVICHQGSCYCASQSSQKHFAACKQTITRGSPY